MSSRDKKRVPMNAIPTDLFELDKPDADDFDSDYMGDTPYFLDHEGEYYFIDAEDLDNDTRVILEDNKCYSTIPGFCVVLYTEHHIQAARKMLADDKYTNSCIVRFNGVTQLLITHDISYLQKAIEQRLNTAQEELD